MTCHFCVLEAQRVIQIFWDGTEGTMAPVCHACALRYQISIGPLSVVEPEYIAWWAWWDKSGAKEWSFHYSRINYPGKTLS